MSNSSGSSSVYVQAAKAVPELAAKTVITATKVAESGLKVAETAGRITERLAGSAEKIADSVEKHSGALVNATLNIGQHGLNTVKSVTKGISSAAEIVSIQANKKLAVSSNRLKAIQATSNERTASEKKKILIQIELDQKKAELDKQKNFLKKNYQSEANKKKHNMNMLVLEKNTTNTLIKFYENEINIVKNISNDINNSLKNVRDTICAGKYFSFSLSCKRHKNFNSGGFRLKIDSIRKTYKIYCENIIIKLRSKLKMAAISKKLDVFTNYYIEQVQILTDINTKLLDYVVEIQSITIKNTILDKNKKNINSSISKLENLIGKNKSKPEFSTANSNRKPEFSTANSNRKPEFSTANSNRKPEFSTANSNNKSQISTANFNNKPKFSKANSNSKPGFSTANSNSKPGFSTANLNSKPGFSTANLNSKPGFSTAKFNNKPEFSTANSNNKPQILTANSINKPDILIENL
jgi:hypothetical protein